MKEIWFFDTNCISFLLDSIKNGQSYKIARLVSGKTVLISDLVIRELVKGSSRLEELIHLSAIADVKYVITNQLHVIESISYTLDETPLLVALNHLILISGKNAKYIFDNFSQDEYSKIEWDKAYLNKVVKDVGVSSSGFIDSKSFQAYVTQQIIRASKSYADVKAVRVNNIRFPFSIIFHYLYWERYAKDRSAHVNSNDLFDLVNSQLIPMCSRYFTDASFASTILKLKGKRPISQHKLFSFFKKNGVENEYIEMVLNDEEAKVAALFYEDCAVYSLKDLRLMI